MTPHNREAYDLGRLNAEQGMSIKGNPYDGRTRNGRAWVKGWQAFWNGECKDAPK